MNKHQILQAFARRDSASKIYTKWKVKLIGHDIDTYLGIPKSEERMSVVCRQHIETINMLASFMMHEFIDTILEELIATILSIEEEKNDRSRHTAGVS